MSSANQMLGFSIRASNEADAELKAAAESLGLVEKAAADADAATGNLDSTWDRLQAGVDELGNSLDNLAEKIDPEGGALAAAAEGFGNLEKTLIGVKDVLGVVEEQFGVSLGPMNDYIGAAADVAGGMEGMIVGGTELVKQFGPMLAGMGPVIASTWGYVTALTAQAVAMIAANWPILAIIASLALVAGAVYLVIQHWDTITQKVPILQTALDGVVSFFNGTVVPAFDTVWGALQKVIDFVTNNWPIVASLILLPFAPLILLATDAFGVRSALEGAFNGIIDFLGGLLGSIGEKGTAMGTALKDGFISGVKGVVEIGQSIAEGILGAIKWLINQAIQAVNDLIPDQIQFSVGFGDLSKTITIPLPNNPIPQLADGGIVTRPTLALIGEAGPEAVVPLSRAGRGMGAGFGTEVHLHITTMDAWSFKEWLDRGGGDSIADHFMHRQAA